MFQKMFCFRPRSNAMFLSWKGDLLNGNKSNSGFDVKSRRHCYISIVMQLKIIDRKIIFPSLTLWKQIFNAKSRLTL